MRRILSLACGLGVMLGVAGPAWAQATAEEAARLTAVFEAWLPPMEDLAPAEADYLAARLAVNHVIGRWQVDPDGDGYRIRTPGVRTAVAETLWPVTGEIMLACDPDQWRATPAAGGGYALSADTPPACRLERQGGPAWPVGIGRRRFSGSVDPGAGGLAMDTVLDQVTVGRAGAAAVATIDRLTLFTGLTPAAGGRRDVVQRFALDGVAFVDPEGGGTTTAGRIALDTRTDGVDARAMAGPAVVLARRLGRLPDYPRPMPGTSPDSIFGDGLRVLPVMDTLFDGMGSGGHHETMIEGLRAAIPGGTIRIDSLTVRFAISDLDREAGGITVSFDSRGMRDVAPSPYDAWLPTEATIRVSGQNLPVRALLTEGMLPGEPDSKRMGAMLQGTQARILFDPFRLSAPEGLLDLSGALWSSGGKQVMTGRLDLRLGGLDGLIKVLQADPDPEAGGAVAGLSMLQVLGRQATLPDGRAARDYEIVLGPSKGLLVNGADVRELLREFLEEPR